MLVVVTMLCQKQPFVGTVGVGESATEVPSVETEFRTSIWVGTSEGFTLSNDPKAAKKGESSNNFTKGEL